MADLILVRHGESEWNKKDLWTGLADVSLSENGKKEARRVAFELSNLKIDIAYTSVLKRAKETLDIIKKVLNLHDLPETESKALNERDYGEFTGKNKWEIENVYGEETFKKIRRGWNYPIKAGETLKDVYNRVVPCYKQEILPKLKNGKNVLIVAHGNSLRALIKYLGSISDDDISNIELKTGEIYTYHVGRDGKVTY